jgi:hypothetical protein
MAGASITAPRYTVATSGLHWLRLLSAGAAWPGSYRVRVLVADTAREGPPPGPASSAPPGPARAAGPALAAVALLAALLAGLLLRYGRYAIDSDSVAQQSLVDTWLRAGHLSTYLPPDTWILKLPVYALVEPLPLSTPVRILIETLILNGAGYLLVAWACWTIAGRCGFDRRWSDVVLPVAWLTTLAGGVGGYLSIMPNTRNLELGLAFVVLAQLGRLTGPRSGPAPGWGGLSRGRRVRRVAAWSAAVLGLSLMWVDDPYFAVLLGLPALLACLGWYRWRQRRPELLVAAAVFAASLLAVPVVKLLLATAGLQVVKDSVGLSVQPGQVLHRLTLLWPGLQQQLGDDGPTRGAAIAHTAAVLLLLVGIGCSIGLARIGWRLPNLALLLLSLHWVLVVAGVLANRTVVDYHGGRYLMPAMLDLAVGLGLAAAALRGRRRLVAGGLTCLLALATVANLAQLALHPASVPVTFAQRASILAAIRASGTDKGFAQFWSTNVYIHQSRGELNISGVVCDQGMLKPDHWLTDTARTRVPADRSFLIWEQGYFPNCPLSTLERQFGSPERVTPLLSPTGAGPAYLLVYPRDLTSLLAPA